MRALEHIRRSWRDASLVRRFSLAGGLVMVLQMAAVGSWVADRIAQGVIRQNAALTVHLLESIVSPLGEDLAISDTLTPGPVRALEELLAAPAFRDRIVSFKIWKRDGLVAFATDPALIGRRFPPTPALRAAWAGAIIAEYDDLADAESLGEAALGRPLTEVYSPIHANWSGEVVAVMEFYEDARALAAEIAAARRTSWLVVGGATAVAALLLFGIVGAGSRTIESQRRQLEGQVAELGALARANLDLRMRVQRASAGAAETNEVYLRRIGADLHDGPAQLLSLAMLRLDGIETEPDPARREARIAELREALRTAMAEIRNISRGLSLPELRGRGLGEVIRRAADAHAALTGAEVTLDLPEEDPAMPHSALIAVYRFVQEGLSNATRHAGGAGLRVAAALAPGGLIEIAVSDAGPGFDPAAPPRPGGLGLRGLAERIESLGGSFAIDSRPGAGTTLRLGLRITEEPALA